MRIDKKIFTQSDHLRVDLYKRAHRYDKQTKINY